MGLFKNKNKIKSEVEYPNTSINDVEELQTFRNEEATESTITKTIARDVNRRTPLFQPTAYSVIKPMVDELIQYKVILIDLSKLTDADKKRTIDFLTGVMYGLNGEFTKVENKIYKFIVRK